METKANHSKGNYNIITPGKPIVFRKRKITKISDLIQTKNKKDHSSSKEEKNDNDNDWELTEEFFDRYFKRYESENISKRNLKNSDKNINEVKNNSPASNTKNILNDKDLHFSNFDEEDKPATKKKKFIFSTYTTSIVISQCSIDTVKNIQVDLAELLAEVSKNCKMAKDPPLNYIQWIDLSHNKIKEIHPDITQIPNLKFLNLNHNLISDLNKITPLGEIKFLTKLTLSGNEVCKLRGYRQFVIEMCPVLEQLDCADVTEKELEIIHFGGSKFGEKRENGNGRVIRYPKLPYTTKEQNTLKTAKKNKK